MEGSEDGEGDYQARPEHTRSEGVGGENGCDQRCQHGDGGRWLMLDSGCGLRGWMLDWDGLMDGITLVK